MITLREQLCQVDGLRAWLVLGEWIGHGDAFAVRQDGQVVLLTIAEPLGRSHHLRNKQGIVNCQL